MIDWTRVIQLRDEVGPEDFEEVVDIFLEEVDDEIAMLGEVSKPDKLESQLHFLKGSALNLGFEAFSKLCSDGEAQAAEGNTQEIDLNAISSSYANSKIIFLDQLEDHL